MQSKTNLYLLISFIIFLLLSFINANSQSKIDSISNILSKKLPEKSRLAFYNLIAEEILNQDPNKALVYLDSAIDLSLKLDNIAEYALALQRKSVIYNNIGNYREAIVIGKKSLEFFRESPDTLKLIDAYSSVGISYGYLLEYEDALEYFVKGLELAEQKKDTSSLILMLNDIAYIYNVQNEFKKALPILLRTLTMKKGLPNELPIVMGYVNISTVYFNLDSNDIAISYLDTAETIANKWELKLVKQAVYQRRGIIFQKLGEYEKAIESLKSAFIIQEELANKRGMSTTLSVLGNIFLDFEKIDSAFLYFDKSLDIAKTNNFADIVKDVLKGKSNAYYKLGKYKESIQLLTEHYSMKDSLSNNSVKKQLAEIEAMYESEKKEQELIYQSNVISYQKNVLVLVLISLLITLIILIIALIQKRKKNQAYKILVKTNLELTKCNVNKIDNSEKHSDEKSENDLQPEYEKTEKYSKSGLEESQKAKLLNDILLLMEEKKPFLKTDITVTEVADELGVYVKYISQVVNEKFDKNFYNFINEYRIKEARQMLVSDKYDNLSIEGIANSVGFNSKSSFNTAFKKFTGLTPSFFRESAKQQLNK